MGNWKGIRKDIFDDQMEIELYDLSLDAAESRNVAAENPDIVAQIAQIMEKEHTPAEIERFRMKQLGD